MRSSRQIKLLFPALLTAAAAAAGCVPPGNATPDDAGTASATPVSTLPRAPANVLTTVFEDTFERPEGGPASKLPPLSSMGNLTAEGGADTTPTSAGEAGANASGDLRDGGNAAADGGVRMRRFLDTLPDGAMVLRTVPVPMGSQDKPAQSGQPFQPAPGEDKTNIGPNWTQAQTNAWHIEDGWLCVENAHNHGIWFSRPIPINARIEWDAKGDSPEGDLKVELWGDGRGFAKGNSYNDATSYLAILGGWKNTLHVLARLDEHKEDRKVVRVDKDSDDPRQRPVMRGQVYHLKVERNDAKTVRYYVDTLLMATFVDAEPLMGPGHDHFGFNDWEAKVCFDNVKITPLPQ